MRTARRRRRRSSPAPAAGRSRSRSPQATDEQQQRRRRRRQQQCGGSGGAGVAGKETDSLPKPPLRAWVACPPRPSARYISDRPEARGQGVRIDAHARFCLAGADAVRPWDRPLRDRGVSFGHEWTGYWAAAKGPNALTVALRRAKTAAKAEAEGFRSAASVAA
jgi:hypothetical protein